MNWRIYKALCPQGEHNFRFTYLLDVGGETRVEARGTYFEAARMAFAKALAEAPSVRCLDRVEIEVSA